MKIFRGNVCRTIVLFVAMGISVMIGYAKTRAKYDVIQIVDGKTFNVAVSDKDIKSFSDAKWGVIDRTGKVLIKPQYSWPANYTGDYAAVYKNDKCGVINRVGKEVLPCKYYNVTIFEDNIAIANSGDVKKVVNLKTGATLCSFDSKKTNIYPVAYGDGLIVAHNTKNNKYIFLNLKGKKVINTEYKRANAFHEGLAGVVINGKVTYINKAGKRAFKKDFYLPHWDDELEGEEIDVFKNGLAIVCKIAKSKSGDLKEYMGAIDKNGNEVIPIKYEWVERNKSGNYIASTSNKDRTTKWDYYNAKGKLIKSKKLPWNSAYDPAGDTWVVEKQDKKTGHKYYQILKSGRPIAGGQKYTQVDEGAFCNGSGYTYVLLPGDDYWSIIDTNGKVIFRNISMTIPRYFFPG